MSVRLVVQPHTCIGCRACEMACAFSHGTSGNPGTSRCQTITLGKNEYVPMLCLQCDRAACVQSCPTSAIALDPKAGIVRVSHDRCIRCMACTVACPFGNMRFDGSSVRVHKCDLCEQVGGNPRCAMFCPTTCLTIEHLGG
jgi:carbon-monoxide dehydrogenase iron sulfur subunit